MKSFAVILLISHGLVTFAIGDDSSNNTTPNPNSFANQIVDQIITQLTTAKSFDPLVIEEEKSNFNKKVGAIKMKGTLDMNNTKITGLSHVHREGDAKLSSKNGSFEAAIHLGDKNVKFFTDIKIQMDKIIHPHLKIEADMGSLKVSFAVDLDSDGKPALGSFTMDEFKHVQIKVKGLSVLDPLVDLIADSYIEFANKKARQLLEKIIKPIIEKEIKNIKLGY